MNCFNTIIVDNHPITLLGIKNTLTHFSEVNITLESYELDKITNTLTTDNVNLLIASLSLLNSNGNDPVTYLEKIKQLKPTLNIIILVMDLCSPVLKTIHKLNMSSLITKENILTDLPEALIAIQQGNNFISQQLLPYLVQKNKIENNLSLLTPRENEVINLFYEGIIVSDIAKMLGRSIKTISSQKKSAMLKLNVDNDIKLLNYLASIPTRSIK